MAAAGITALLKKMDYKDVVNIFNFFPRKCTYKGNLRLRVNNFYKNIIRTSYYGVIKKYVLKWGGGGVNTEYPGLTV
jgi:hypothetical protein